MNVEKINPHQWLVTEKKYRNIVSKDWFEIDYWHKRGAVDGEAKGRGTTYFFNENNKHYVLRQYRRGGFVGKIVEKSYWFNGVKQTRAYQELRLLKQMRKKKLPVPKPVCALVTVENLRYEASIIIRLIKNAQDLFHVLKINSLSEQQWQQVGLMLKQFHNHGLFHADLNVHNIMLNKKDKFWLIDFDKGKWIEPNSTKLEANLDRLLRSLRKEKSKFPAFNWQESDWACLLQGYASN